MLLLVLQELIEWKWMTDFLGNYQILNQHFSLAVRVKKDNPLDKTKSWPELEGEEDVHPKTQFTYLGLLPKINSLCQVAISAVYYHRHLALNRPPESECILTSLILVVSSVNFILGLLICFSNWNTIKNSYWAKLLSGILNLFFSVWMPLDIGLDILMNTRYYNQSPDWNQQLSNTSNKICNQTVLEEQWEKVEDIFKPFETVSRLNCSLALDGGYFAAGLPCLLLPPVIFGTTFVWFKTADLALVCS